MMRPGAPQGASSGVGQEAAHAAAMEYRKRSIKAAVRQLVGEGRLAEAWATTKPTPQSTVFNEVKARLGSAFHLGKEEQRLVIDAVCDLLPGVAHRHSATPADGKEVYRVFLNLAINDILQQQMQTPPPPALLTQQELQHHHHNNYQHQHQQQQQQQQQQQRSWASMGAAGFYVPQPTSSSASLPASFATAQPPMPPAGLPHPGHKRPYGTIDRVTASEASSTAGPLARPMGKDGDADVGTAGGERDDFTDEVDTPSYQSPSLKVRE
jgi:hypothetical protein